MTKLENYAKKMSDKELIEEINSSEQLIECCGYSKRDLILNQMLWNEAESRELDIKIKYHG